MADQLQEASAAEIRAAAASIVNKVVAFVRSLIGRNEKFLRENLSGRAPLDVVDDAIALERERAEQFVEATKARIEVQLPVALAIPDPVARRVAVQSITRREGRFAAQRSEAMVARAAATTDRAVLKLSSPQGAFWKLDPNVREHTAGCLIMGGKFWPWVVLDRVHPPRHYGCPCELVGMGQALTSGLMTPEAIRTPGEALRAAGAVVMEAEDPVAFAALVETIEMREELERRGMATPEWLDVHLPV